MADDVPSPTPARCAFDFATTIPRIDLPPPQPSSDQSLRQSTMSPVSPCPQMTRKIDLNVGGTRFSTTASTLSQESDWVLWNTWMQSASEFETEFFFDADPVVFEWILQRLRSKQELPCPPYLSGRFVRQQLDLWGLSHWWPKKKEYNLVHSTYIALLDDAMTFFSEGNKLYIMSDHKVPRARRLAQQSADTCDAIELSEWSHIDGLGMWCSDCTILRALEFRRKIPNKNVGDGSKSLFDYFMMCGCWSAEEVLRCPRAKEIDGLCDQVAMWVEHFERVKARMAQTMSLARRIQKWVIIPANLTELNRHMSKCGIRVFRRLHTEQIAFGVVFSECVRAPLLDDGVCGLTRSAKAKPGYCFETGYYS